MKIQIINNLEMQWVPNYKEVFPEADWNETPQNGYDATLWMWGKDINTDITGRHVVFIRRYEWYLMEWKKWDYSRISDVIFVNDFFYQLAQGHINTNLHVIYNGIDTSKWTYKKRGHGNKLAWVGYINQKKNIPLVLQIMSLLPRCYELHLAGGMQDSATMDYLQHIASELAIKVVWNGHIPRQHMDEWLDDKNYLLSTAISEGCPNSVLEALAKGIKPLVHSWPGSFSQFGNIVFINAQTAASEIIRGDYNSARYLKIAKDLFSVDNYTKVMEIVCQD